MSAEYWIWLQQVLGFGNEAVGRVISVYGDAESFYYADDREKTAKCGLSKSQTERLHRVMRKEVYGVIKDCERNGIEILTPSDEEYPERLLNIPDPPAVLYIKGRKVAFNGEPSVAVVGPRKISDYGYRCGYVISDTLASCGFTVVSGGALGGDTAAHLGAIASGGVTVAVLGAGIESDYLKTNAPLRDKIAENGCLVSEFPPFYGVMKGSFQIRNRIISGLCNGTVILEGASGSGTLITARHACEQGRDVFVIPGSPSLPQYEGSNRLISDGARPLLNVNEIINEYIFLYQDKIHTPNRTVAVDDNSVSVPKAELKPEATDKKATPCKEKERTLPDLSLLSNGTAEVVKLLKNDFDEFSVDDICDKGIDVGNAFTAVTELEICGFTEALPGGRYRFKI